MAAKKIFFFTAGAIPTSNEQIAINKLNALAAAAYEVKVKRGDVPTDQEYGYGKEECDYVAFVSPMTKPTAYTAKTTFNPDAPANGGNLLSTQAIISSGQQLTVPVTGSYSTKATPTIVGGVVTAIVLS